MYLLVDFGSGVNKRLKRAAMRALNPADDAVSAIQKARGRKPSEVYMQGLTRSKVPIDRNDPPRLTRRVVGTLKAIKDSPVEISQTLYANSKTGAVPKSKINRAMRSTGTESTAALKTRKSSVYDQAVHIHNHPGSPATPSMNDLAAIGATVPLKSGISPTKSKGYITGLSGFHVTKYKAEPTSMKQLSKYDKTLKKTTKDNPMDNETIRSKGLKQFTDNIKTVTKRASERNKGMKTKVEQYGLD